MKTKWNTLWIFLNSIEHANLEKSGYQKTPSGCSIDSGHQHAWHAPIHGFPLEVNCWGGLLAKTVKNCIKSATSAFLEQIVWGTWGNMGGISQSFGCWGKSPPNPPIMENPTTCTHIWFLMGQFWGIVGMRVKNKVNYLVL